MIEKLLCPEGLGCVALFVGGLMGWVSSYLKWPNLALIFKGVMMTALAAFILVVPAQAQSPERDAAKAEAETLASDLQAEVQAGATASVTPDSVPGFVTDRPGEVQHYSQGAGLESAGQAASFSDPNAIAVRTSITSRPQISSEELGAWTGSGLGIEADALSIMREYGGAYGDCTTEISAGTGETSYTYTCTSGDTLLEYQPSCNVPLNVSFEPEYVYQCRDLWNDGDCIHRIDETCLELFSNPTCSGWRRISSGQCRPVIGHCGNRCADVVLEATCTEPTPGLTPVQTRPGPITESWQVASCASHESNGDCTLVSEVCTQGPETRLINGVAITRDCWKRTRTYDCKSVGDRIDDCNPPAGCALTASTCLSHDDATGACRAEEHEYTCTVAGTPGGAVGYCEEDVYCIDGDCETLTRPQNDEFPQAISALSVLGALQDEVSQGTLEIFPGENAHCERSIGGLQNCCSNDGLLVDIGFGCSANDRALAERQKAGLCHYVGTYCSDRTFFGICLKKRRTFCCFSGKLARIIHEQGRPQVGWSWGRTSRPDCSGFTVALFQQLDLSRIDFSEFYSDVLSSFSPPDGDAVSASITNRIVDAYGCHPNC